MAPLVAGRRGLASTFFHPAMVARAVPDAWDFAPPAAILEARTDALAGPPFEALTPAQHGVLTELLQPLVDRVPEAGLVPLPHPMGLPEPLR